MLITFLYQCEGTKSIAVTETNPMEIYLCIGQSNMAGRALIEQQDLDSLNNVFLFTNNDNEAWEKAANPLNKYSTVRKNIDMQKLGPSYTFAKTMVQARTGKNIGLVVNAKGGTAIEAWKPGGILYNEAVIQAKKALKYGGVLKGIIWHQGEANTSNYTQYIPKITALIAAFRNDFNAPNLPFVAGQLSPDKQVRNNFNKMIIKLPENVKYTSVVTTENTATIDSTH